MTDKVSPAMQKAIDEAKADMKARTAREKERANKMPSHMATLNLFREPNGEYRITVAEARGFINSYEGVMRAAPIYYVEGAIIDAAELMKKEREQER